MKLRITISIALLAFFTTCYGQQKSTWDKWNWLIGEWIGEGSGQPGQGGGYFSLKADLDNNILVRKNHAEFPASGNRPKAVHDDLMIVYPDNTGNLFKAIYFDNEGHTINYQVTFGENAVIMTSEKLPDTPVFRLTYTMFDNETVNTKFEMSQDNVSFTTYVEGKSKKTK